MNTNDFAGLVDELRRAAMEHYHADARRARHLALECVRLAEKSGDRHVRATADRTMGEALLYSGRIAESQEFLASSAKRFRSAGDGAMCGQVLVGQVHVLTLLGKTSAALRAAERARSLLESSGDEVYLAKLSMNLGNLHFQKDRPREALSEYDDAAERFRRAGQRDELVFGLEINRGVMMTQLDRHDEALDLFASLDDEAAQRKLRIFGAQVRMNKAYVHSLRAEYGDALHALDAATSFFRETNHPAFLGSCLLNRAEVYNQLGLADLADHAAREALPHFQSTKLRFDEGLTYAELSTAALRGDDLDEVAGWLRRAKRIFRAEENAPRTSLIDLMGAELAARRGRKRRAIELAATAVESFRSMRLVRWEAVATILLARLDPDRARGSLRTLSRRVRPELFPSLALQISEAVADDHARRGRRDEAYRVYKRAAAILSELRPRIPTEEMKLAFLRDRTRLFDGLVALESTRLRPSITKLFQWMEVAKAQVLEDQARGPGEYTGGDADLRGRDGATHSDDLERERRNLSWLHTRLSRLELDSPEKTSELRSLRKRLVEEERRWSIRVARAEEAKRALRGGAATPPPAELTAREVRRALPPDTGFISFFTGDDASIVMVVTKGRTVWRELPSRFLEKLESRVRDLDFLWESACVASAGDGGAAPRLARLRMLIDDLLSDLYRLIWEPIDDMCKRPPRHWIVSPHGPIHRVPLPALKDSRGYLAERHDLTLTPSARVWLDRLDVSAAESRAAWVVGVPSESLPDVRREVESVAEALGRWRVETDLEPTRRRFLDMAPRYRLLHVAAHGSLRPDNPAYSFVELADGPLFVHDLRSCRLDGATVVLSACSSGQGVAPAGNEWIGLARSFLNAGAASIVGSLWPIHDSATRELIGGFYRRFADDPSPARSLGATMRELAAADAHPWQWAAFAVFGGGGPEGDRPIAEV